MKLDYIKYNEEGYPYNGIFPPTLDPYNGYDGYETPGEAALFYNYAVHGYNLEFKYNGITYVLLGPADGGPIALLDSEGKQLQSFKDPMDAVMNCTIQGHRLMDIMDEISDIECC